MKIQVLVVAILVLCTRNVFADETPEDIVNRAMSSMVSGKTDEAKTYYIVKNDRQRQSVQTTVEQGFREMSSLGASIKALRTFTKDDCSIVIVEVFLAKAPSQYDVGSCCLVLGPQGWRLLPEFQLYSGQVNDITEVQMESFKTIWPSAEEYRMKEMKVRREPQSKTSAENSNREQKPSAEQSE